MAANCATKEEFIVGWGFHPNNKNIVQQNSYVCENLHGEQTLVTPLTHAPETRMNRAFAGGGGSNFKPHKAFTYIIQKCNRLNVFKRNTS